MIRTYQILDNFSGQLIPGIELSGKKSLDIGGRRE